jgi:hypothetical protein
MNVKRFKIVQDAPPPKKVSKLIEQQERFEYRHETFFYCLSCEKAIEEDKEVF